MGCKNKDTSYFTGRQFSGQESKNMQKLNLKLGTKLEWLLESILPNTAKPKSKIQKNLCFMKKKFGRIDFGQLE